MNRHPDVARRATGRRSLRAVSTPRSCADSHDALAFYVRRDTNPEEFYPISEDGTVQKFDDLPVALHGNVNTEEVPCDRKRGEAPRLTEGELADLETFLNALTGGYQIVPATSP